eukprot:COSAG04_NODE_23085_length_344_cov_0.828571_1_plen_98_part_01
MLHFTSNCVVLRPADGGDDDAAAGGGRGEQRGGKGRWRVRGGLRPGAAARRAAAVAPAVVPVHETRLCFANAGLGNPASSMALHICLVTEVSHFRFFY